MSVGITMLMLAAMLVAALLLMPLANRWRLPLAAVLVVTGFIASEIFVYFDADTGIRFDDFHDLIMYVFLPVLIFSAAFTIDAGILKKNLLIILFLALPILLFSTAVAAVLIYFGIGHETGFPWVAAFLTGAILSSTDASPITTRFAALGVPKRLRVLMEGEDLFNDATSIVLFGIFLYIAMHPMEDITVSDAVIRFFIVFFGGGLIGLLVGLGFLLVSRLFEEPIHQALLTLISAYASFLLAQEVLNVSGVMAVLITGLIMGRVIHNDFQDERGTFVDNFWEFNVYIAEALVYLLMGVTITFAMFEERWLAMIIGIVAVVVARAIGVFGAVPVLNFLPIGKPIDFRYQKILVVGSLRGAVALALSLSLPVELPYWWTIQSITFGVVLFSLIMQAPCVEPMLRKSELVEKSDD